MSIKVTTYVAKEVLLSHIDEQLVKLSLRSKELETELADLNSRVIKGPHDGFTAEHINALINAIGDDVAALVFKRKCIETGADEPRTEIEL